MDRTDLRSQSTDTEVELTEGMNLDKAVVTGVKL